MSPTSLVLAPEGFSGELQAELQQLGVRYQELRSDLFITENPLLSPPLWSAEHWQQSEIVNFKSIGDAQKILKSMGPLWYALPFENIRRQALILEGLPKVRQEVLLEFQIPKPRIINSFFLLSETQMLVAKAPQTSFPAGAYAFQENKTDPPSRAYLKLWEVFARIGKYPTAKDVVVDLGACPGGWTWVLAKVAKKVIAVDKADIDPRLLRLPQVTQLRQDAFNLDPKSLGPIQWVFSDIICDPHRLYELVSNWQQAGVENFITTLKFKGSTDFSAIEKFKKIEGGHLIHLHHNKHEVTWIKIKN